MRSTLRFVAAAACLCVAPAPAFAQDKPKLLAVDGFMFKGVFTELEPEQMKRRPAGRDRQASFRRPGNANRGNPEIHAPTSEKMRGRVDEPLEVRGEIPVTLPPNTMGNDGVHRGRVFMRLISTD